MKKIFMTLFLLLVSIGLVACNSAESDQVHEEGEMVTITHELGEVTVPKKPEKVVVFDFGALDTLDKLGIHVVGLPKANIPSYLKKYEASEYENVGSLKEPDFEKLANIDPDLIIISGRQSTLYDQLSELGKTVYLDIDTNHYMDSFKKNLNILGKIFDKEAEIEKEIEKIEASIKALQEKARSSDKNALIILANDDKISAYGSNSRFGLIHDVFGIQAVDENIEAATHGQNIGFEYVVEEDPDLLYVIDRGAAVGGESSAKIVVENKLMENTKAYQNDQIYYLDPEYWYLSGGGLVSLTKMVEDIAGSLE